MKGSILVIGSEGLVGSRYVEISELRKSFYIPRQVEFDITSPSETKAIVSSYNFGAIVNFAAITDVDMAEKERGDEGGLCWQVNVEGVRNLVEAVKPFRQRIHFVQISTDMVFPGTRDDPGPYLENHPLDHEAAQLTWYGYTKAQGERLVREILEEHATILRLIYPVRAHFAEKLDYLRKMLKLYDEGRLYPLFSDQQISITFIDEACKIIDTILKNNLKGVFHASSRDTTTPYELGSYFLEKVRAARDIKAASLDEFLLKSGDEVFRYPKFGGLSVQISEHKLAMRFSSWREIIDKLIGQGVAQT